MSVITISRQFGSGGDEIAASICSQTGFKLFDKQILTIAAIESGLTDQEVGDFCEDDFRVKNFFERLFGSPRPVAQARLRKEDIDGAQVMEEKPLNEEQALDCVQKATQKAYEIGNYVIVGRGGQVLLKDQPSVLHVRVVAPLENRLLWVRNSPLMAGRKFADSVEARRAAQDLIEKHDEASASYLMRFYGTDWADLGLYHLVINTSKLPIEIAARLVIETAQALQPAAT